MTWLIYAIQIKGPLIYVIIQEFFRVILFMAFKGLFKLKWLEYLGKQKIAGRKFWPVVVYLIMAGSIHCYETVWIRLILYYYKYFYLSKQI